MNIKRYKNTKKRQAIKLKKEINVNGGEGMVVCLDEYKTKNNSNPSIKISLVDMLFDKEKRNEMYARYDKKYVSTKEEDDICSDMMNYYSREKKK